VDCQGKSRRLSLASTGDFSAVIYGVFEAVFHDLGATLVVAKRQYPADQIPEILSGLWKKAIVDGEVKGDGPDWAMHSLIKETFEIQTLRIPDNSFSQEEIKAA